MSKRNRDKHLRTDSIPVENVARTAEQKHVRRVRLLISAFAGVFVVGILGVSLYAVMNQPVDTTVKPDPKAYAPANAIAAGDKYEYGVSYYLPKQKVPVVEIFEDFQCPICAKFEQGAGDILLRYAQEGRARVIWRTASFLDKNLGNDSSSRAANAWGCAQDVGKGSEYHGVVFKNQPATEGAGWTDDEFVSYGVMAGMNEEQFNSFKKCLVAKPYLVWAANGTEAFRDNNLDRTPTVRLDGTILPQETAMNPVLLEQAIKDATSKDVQFPTAPTVPPSPTASPEASPSVSESPSPSASPSPTKTKKPKKNKS